jgi:hypothetical protein
MRQLPLTQIDQRPLPEPFKGCRIKQRALSAFRGDNLLGGGIWLSSLQGQVKVKKLGLIAQGLGKMAGEKAEFGEPG